MTRLLCELLPGCQNRVGGLKTRLLLKLKRVGETRPEQNSLSGTIVSEYEQPLSGPQILPMFLAAKMSDEDELAAKIASGISIRLLAEKNHSIRVGGNTWRQFFEAPAGGTCWCDCSLTIRGEAVPGSSGTYSIGGPGEAAVTSDSSVSSSNKFTLTFAYGLAALGKKHIR
jgi:hypothetical protein